MFNHINLLCLVFAHTVFLLCMAKLSQVGHVSALRGKTGRGKKTLSPEHYTCINTTLSPPVHHHTTTVNNWSVITDIHLVGVTSVYVNPGL